ncbi:MAG: VanZ family protein [Kangiellaceae bacterium]|nr:VanZ family protein [Kangiellaceae bacterium]
MKIKAHIQTLVSEQYSLAWKFVFWANCALLLFLTLSPEVYHRPTFSNVDKVYHFIGFAAFAGFLVLAFPKFKAWLAICISILLGIAIEIAQHYIPHRGASFGDLSADILGAVVAVCVIILLRRLATSN